MRPVKIWEFLAVSWRVDGAINGGVDIFGGYWSHQISVLRDEAGECWLQHRNEADSVCLRRSGSGCMLLQRCGKRDFLSIRVKKSCEINAITYSTVRRDVQSVKSELRVLRTGHLSTSEVGLPWTPEEKLRHESNGHAEYDNSCEICVKSSGISRHPRRMHSESFAFYHTSVTFKESDGYVTVVDWQKTPMRMLLSSCSARRSGSEGLGTFSHSHPSGISLSASEI